MFSALKSLFFRVFAFSVVLFAMFNSSNILANTTNYRSDFIQEVWHLHTDKTYVVDIVNKLTPLTPLGVDMLANEQVTFFPDKERLELIEGYVIKPNGKSVKLSTHSVYTRPTPLSATASGYTNSLVTTVIFPQLQPGSQRVTHWKLTRFKPDTYKGITITQMPTFDSAVTRQEVIIHKPNALFLQWGKRGDYQVRTQQGHSETLIQAWIENKPAEAGEVSMTSEADYQSIFVASTHAAWEDIGRIYYQLSADKSLVTPEIQLLAKKIVGNKRGLAAARALYNWTAQNIHYISLSLNDAGGYVPHFAAEILNNRYGDCKDYAILLQTLLKAVGIKSYTALVDWGSLFTQLPVPTPQQFNHAIIYLPDYHLFANPTDPTASFAVLDERLANKFTVIASEKGEIAYTPLNKPEDNKYTLENEIELRDNGDINGQSRLQVKGNLNNHLRRIINASISMQKLADSALSETPEGGTGIISASDPTDLDHDMIIHTKWHSPFAATMNQQVYLNTPYGIDCFLPSELRHLVTYSKRHYPAFMRASTLIWHYKIHVPAHYQVEALPINAIFKNAVGQYQSTYQQNKATIEVIRQLIIDKSYYQPEEYENLNQLIFKLVNDSKSTIVLKRNQV